MRLSQVICDGFSYFGSTFDTYPTTSSFLKRKMPYFLKRLSAINFVSYHRFDYPHGMSVSKKHYNQFLASLSGHLHKVDIICRFAKTRFAQTLAKRHNVLFRRPRKRSTKQLKRCFLVSRTYRSGLFEPWEDSK